MAQDISLVAISPKRRPVPQPSPRPRRGPAPARPTPRRSALSRNPTSACSIPIWTTAYITRNHGYMVFDSLFALDAEYAPHPQMVGDYHVSPDKLTYSFTLRDEAQIP